MFLSIKHVIDLTPIQTNLSQNSFLSTLKFFRRCRIDQSWNMSELVYIHPIPSLTGEQQWRMSEV